MDLKASDLLEAGLRAQSIRLRVISENMANANSTALMPSEDPYRRKTVIFQNILDSQSDLKTVQVTGINRLPGPFPLKYDPANSAADHNGYVKMPNVNGLIEMADFKDAERSYAAAIDAGEAIDSMTKNGIALLD